MSGYGTGSSTVTLGSDPSCGPTVARTTGLRCTGNTTRTSGLAVASWRNAAAYVAQPVAP